MNFYDSTGNAVPLASVIRLLKLVLKAAAPARSGRGRASPGWAGAATRPHTELKTES